MRTGIRPEVISPLETSRRILEWSGLHQGADLIGDLWQNPKKLPDPGPISCRQIRGEEAIRENIRSCKVLVADPLYRPVSPGEAHFISLPHEAFSGRLFRDRIPDLVHPMEDLQI